MKQDIKKRWIKALRSGKYKQAKGRLRDGDKFCCLGVLCDLVKDEKDDWRWHDLEFVAGLKMEDKELPEEVWKYCGLEDEVASFGPLYTSLAGINDDGASFSQIADIIEQYL